MLAGRKTLGRIAGLLATCVLIGAPAYVLYTTRNTIFAYSLEDRISQVRALFTDSLSVTVTSTEAIQHLGRLSLWVVAAVLWLMLVVTPGVQAAAHMSRVRRTAETVVKAPSGSRWQLKAATWVLSLALFGAAGQTAAAEPTREPIVLQQGDLNNPEDTQHVVLVRKGQSLRAVLSNWLGNNYPDLHSTLSDPQIDDWTRTVLAQNPSDNWTADSYLENVSAMMVQVVLPNTAPTPTTVSSGVDVTSVIGELLPEDVDWGDSSEYDTLDGFGVEPDSGLEASRETTQATVDAATNQYVLVPPGAPTVDTWTEDTISDSQPGSILVKAAAVGAGAAAAIAAGRLLRSLKIWREAAPDSRNTHIGEDETAAVATLAALASKDPTELRTVAARTVAASADTKGVPSMSALMINTNSGEMMALLLRGDQSQPQPDTPWTRPDDNFLWSSSIAEHQAYPGLLAELDAQLDPYPCLVCLGDLPDGAGSLWIDLEVFNNVRIGVRNAPGVNPENAARLGLSTMWSWALELLTGPTSSCEVVVCGFGEDLQMMGARHFPVLNKEALEYVSRRVTELNDQTLDGLLEGRPASQLRMITGSTAALSPLVVFIPFPPKDLTHADTLWEMANFFDRRAVTCVFGFAPPASEKDSTTHFPLVTVAPNPQGGEGAHKASLDNPPLPNLHRQTIDSETQKQIQRVLKRQFKAVTEPVRPTKRRPDHLANVTVPTSRVVPTASAGTEPEHFHLRLFGEPRLYCNNAMLPLLPGDLEMVAFLAAAGRPVTLDELGWVAGHNPSLAERRYVQTRTRLGHDPDGKLFLAPRTYEIQTPRFSCDLHQFENIYNLLVREQTIADPQKRAEAAKSALGLVIGRPFGPAASRWPWTEGFPNATWNVVIKIDQLVHSYARAARTARNWHEVLWATNRRLLVHPSPCVTCYEHAAEAAEASGHTEAASKIRNELHQKKASQDFYLPATASGE